MRRTRKYKKWSQMLVAGKLNLCRTSVTRCEKETEKLSLSNLIRVLDVLDLEIIVRPKKGSDAQLTLDL